MSQSVRRQFESEPSAVRALAGKRCPAPGAETEHPPDRLPAP